MLPIKDHVPQFMTTVYQYFGGSLMHDNELYHKLKKIVKTDVQPVNEKEQ